MLGTSNMVQLKCTYLKVVHSISCDQNKMFPCSVMLDGEYGLTDLCIGVPVILGREWCKENSRIRFKRFRNSKIK